MTYLNESDCADSKLKKDAEELSVSADDSADPFYSEINLEHIRKGIEELEAGKGVENPLIED